MSFAQNVKEEIVLQEHLSSAEKKAFLQGFIKNNGELVFSNARVGLKITSISNLIIRHVFLWLKEIYYGKIEVSIVQTKILQQKKIYTIYLYDDVKKFLTEMKIYDWDHNEKIVAISSTVLEQSNLLWQYIAGVFVACGSVNAPTTSNYHLECQLKDEASAQYFTQVLQKYQFHFKVICKRTKYVCYIKKSLEVSDFLKRIGATKAVFEFENKRVEREVYNSVNRYLNIELHNSKLSIDVATKQTEMINEIKSHGAFGLLPQKAQILADLRLDNPAASFNELVELMNENGVAITKPGISHLFRIIQSLADSLKG